MAAERRIEEEPTGVDEELVSDSWVVDVMNGAGEQSSHDLQVCEHRLGWTETIKWGNLKVNTWNLAF